MADLPISGLTATTTLGTGDLFPVVQGGTTKKITAGNASKSFIETTPKTGNYTLSSSDRIILVDATSGAISIFVPAASGNQGIVWTVKKVDSSGNAVTIDPDASETIDGASTFALTEANQSISFTSDGTNIIILSEKQDDDTGGGAVDSVNGQTGVVVLDADDIDDTSTTNKFTTAADISKLAGIEAGAEVNTIDTIADTSEIDLTVTARQLTASIVSGSIDEAKLDASVNASLDLADSSLQDADIGVSVQAYSAVLDATTASFTTADETKLDGIEALADVTDTTNVTAAGALMDSEVTNLSGIKTLTVPDSTTISSFGATIVDDADAATARTTLGVDAAGTDNSTNVTISGEDYLSLIGQAITANAIDLDNLSATGTADSTTFLRGDNTWATPAGGGDAQYDATAFTSQTSVTVTHNFGFYPVVNVIDNTGAQLIPLSLIHASVNAFTVTFSVSTTGTILSTSGGASVAAVFTNVVNNYTKTQYFGTTTLTDGATINWDLDSNQVAKVTLGGNRTMAAPTNLKDGATYILRVIQDATGSRTITWNAAFKWASGTAPTLSTTANAIDIVTFTSDGTNMYGVAQLNFS